MSAKLLVNWYKPSGKWYAGTELDVPDDFQITYTGEERCVEEFVEKHQDQLGENWIYGDWYVSVTCVQQDNDDTRFFECLLKYGDL